MIRVGKEECASCEDEPNKPTARVFQSNDGELPGKSKSSASAFGGSLSAGRGAESVFVHIAADNGCIPALTTECKREWRSAVSEWQFHAV